MKQRASDGTMMRRTTLLVHDLQRSIAFYEALGFSRWYVGPVGTVSEGGLPVAEVAVGAPSQLTIMKGKHDYLGMVGLLQYGKTTKPGPFALRIGDPILMIEIAQMDVVRRKLDEGGFVIFREPEISHIKSVDDRWDAKFMFVIDPDGHMLELTERLN